MEQLSWPVSTQRSASDKTCRLIVVPPESDGQITKGLAQVDFRTGSSLGLNASGWYRAAVIAVHRELAKLGLRSH